MTRSVVERWSFLLNMIPSASSHPPQPGRSPDVCWSTCFALALLIRVAQASEGGGHSSPASNPTDLRCRPIGHSPQRRQVRSTHNHVSGKQHGQLQLPIIYLFLLIFALCSLFLVVRCLMIYDVYFLCELYLLSLKIFILVSFKNKLIKKKNCPFLILLNVFNPNSYSPFLLHTSPLNL